MTNDKMRAEFEAWCDSYGMEPNEFRPMWDAWQAATRRALPDGFVPVPDAKWRQPGPVTDTHPLECLIVLPALRQSDGEWWVHGTFFPEDDPVAYLPDTPENRAMLQAAPKVGENGND